MLYSMLYNDYVLKRNNSCFIDYEHKKSLIAAHCLCIGLFHVVMKRFFLCFFLNIKYRCITLCKKQYVGLAFMQHIPGVFIMMMTC